MNKNLESYIEFGIECMEADLDWAVNKMEDKEVRYRRAFVRSGIKEERDRMLGTLTYLSCYVKTITDETYEKYRDKVCNAYYEIENKIYRVIK